MFPTIKVTPIARHTTNSPWFSQAFVRGGKEFKGRSSIYPLEYWLGTKCTDARYFLQQFSVVYGKNLINFFICSWKSAWHKIIILQTLYCLFSRLYNFLNPTGPFCTRVSSICPRAKDRKQIGNVASAQNWCSRTTLSRQATQYATLASNNHNTDTSYCRRRKNQRMTQVKMFIHF